MSSGGSSRYWRSNHEMLSRKGNRSGMEISTAGPERMGDMVSGCPQLQLRRQPPAELGGDELHELDGPVRGRQGLERAQLVLPGLPAHRASASSPSVRAPTVTGSGSSASSPSSSAASARFRSPRIQSESVCISLASREMPALSQRLTTLRKKQEASS